MKILHITDSHATVKSPESRTDIYYLSFLKKMYELKYVIEQNDIKMIIHTGDLFHSPRVSDKFTGQLAEVIKSYGIPMYVVPGNHDIDGYNISTLDQTKLGLLYKTGIVKELDRDTSVQLKSQKEGLTINLSGQEYYKDIDTGNTDDFMMQCGAPADFNILAIHGYLCDKPQHPSINFTLCDDIVTDADVILSGHFHESFTYDGGSFNVYNPGSLMRVEQTTYNRKHLPQYGILEVTNNNGVVEHTYTLHEFKIAEPTENVFDYTAKAKTKQTLITLENFKNKIANTNLNANLSVTVENIIEDVANNLAVTQDIIDETKSVYNDAYNSSDKLSIQQGFISENYRKIISSVEINNFQSHKHTVIAFKDGLNVITGESNSGKTSILRAIRWCLDNDPHGSDFITTGENECSVTVTFDDGSKITRKRTRNDAGSYDVLWMGSKPDGTQVPIEQTYKGFSNNIPVEVVNTHQMPKVYLTKDICTHLNMMSQLDNAFLVTESPQVKAAIIGRLTGTQVIDYAIKETNRKVLDNSKTIKIKKELKEKAEQELEPYNDLEQRKEWLDTYSAIVDYYDKEYSKIHKCCEIISDIKETNNNISKLEDTLNKAKNNIQGFSAIVTIYSSIQADIDNIKTCKDYKNTDNNIKALEKRKRWVGIILSVGTILFDRLKLSYGELDTVKTKCDSYKEKDADIKTMKKDLKSLNKRISFISMITNISDNLYTRVTSLSSDVNKVNDVLQDIKTATTLIDEYNNDISFAKSEIDKFTKDIEEANKEQEKIIIDNKICPCCHQPINSKEAVKHISDYIVSNGGR